MMPNAPIEHVNGPFKVLRRIKVVDRETLALVAKVLGIGPEKAQRMDLSDVYIAQGGDPKAPGANTNKS